MGGRSSQCQRKAAERLFVAVVNQAILDVLQGGEEAQCVERWLLSKDFAALQTFFARRATDRDFCAGFGTTSELGPRQHAVVKPANVITARSALLGAASFGLET